MLPKRAMPSAPPSSRVVSFTADPTPAFESGTEVKIRPVAGAVVRAIPAPSTRNATAMTRYGVSGDNAVRIPNPPAMIASPAAITRAAP